MTVDLDTLTPRRHVPAVLAMLSENPDWRIGAEVGVAQGRTTLAMLRHAPKLHLIGVEPFRYIPDSENSGLYADMNFAHNEACVRAVETKHSGRLTILKMTSEEAAREVEDSTLDFVFIDANHSYAEVREDIGYWTPKVRRGGWITGHDYCDKWPGVIRAVDEMLGTPKLFGNTVWAVGQP